MKTRKPLKVWNVYNKYYKEPIQGEFEDATINILEGIKSDTEESDTDIEEKLQN